MPSQLHQMLVGLIGRKMKERGYELIAFDGKEYRFDNQILNIPFTIGKHRPDIIGYKFETKDVSVGEAKSRDDLRTKRTRQQLIDFSITRTTTTGKLVDVIIGIPKSAENELITLLKKLGLSKKENISYIWIPEELVNGT